jgi:hypothetical protein
MEKLNVEDRLKKADQALAEMGVVDKKFFFARHSGSLPSSVYEEVAEMEEAYIKGEYKPMNPAEDRGKRKPKV